MYDMKSSQYFTSLPEHIKKRVWESGIVFNAEEDLRKYVENLEK